ncbi:HAD-IIIC family phosphatase [Streptomyces sp. NPDC002896]|uniref:HAD-IIIC family phosphatase n=1 Tax=Streptomyces sp. NPDC002896 TaxID=3154438 RepID=UPI003324EE0B
MTTETTAATGPLDRLRLMHSDGTLAEQWPALPGLLAELTAGDNPLSALQSAGRLLARIDPGALPDAEQVTVAVCGSSTLDGLVPSLTAELARHRLLLRPRMADFGSWERELLDTKSLVYASGTRLALCVLDASVVFDALSPPWTVADAGDAADALLARLDRLAAHHAEHGHATLVLNTLPLLREHTHQLVDHRSRTELGALWRDFNARLLRLGLRHPRTHVVDLEPLVAAGGPVRDARLAAYAQARLGTGLLAAYAREVAHLTRTLHGRTKKVLVLDADNTLWDGVLGDLGAEGVAAASTYRGEAFGRFQRVVKQLGAQGVLLAVCSKNDPEPLLDVLRTHPDMALREEDFVAVHAGWGPKDAALRDLAKRLDLGEDSFVFADDSSFERAQVAGALPGVDLVALDDEPALHGERLLAEGWFDVPELTDADRRRAAQYRSEGERRQLRESAESYEEFLAGLDVTVELAPARPHEMARVAQLTQRTNQFNLTTRRMSADEVRQAADRGLVLTVAVRDRFGDSGLVGAVFVRADDTDWHIDNALLSCRVFGRGIEQAVFAALLAHARDTGTGAVHGRFRATAKNQRFRDLYPSLGFERTQALPDGSVAYRHLLRGVPESPAHITVTGGPGAIDSSGPAAGTLTGGRP